MPKRSIPDLSTTAFSINRQFTGPPFSVMLESATLRRHLLEEIAHPGTEKLVKTKAGKTAAKRRPKKTRK